MNVGELCDDLLAERADLLGLLGGLDEEGWDLPTPAPGWTVRDQVTHLAYFDVKTEQAIVHPASFRAEREAFVEDVDASVEAVRERHQHLAGAHCLDWLARAGTALAEVARTRDGGERVPWYGPDMSLATAMTARIMETWAHGQDVADALGITVAPSPRLRHVAFLGYRAIPNSFVAHGRDAPASPVHVDLGEVTFGPPDATDVVRGSLLDFCLVATQRRHPADTGLVAQGPIASEWLTVAQAFAGPPGAGRRPGQFS